MIHYDSELATHADDVWVPIAAYEQFVAATVGRLGEDHGLDRVVATELRCLA